MKTLEEMCKLAAEQLTPISESEKEIRSILEGVREKQAEKIRVLFAPTWDEMAGAHARERERIIAKTLGAES